MRLIGCERKYVEKSMARTVNSVTLLGIIADEPVVREFSYNSKVANVTLVTHESTRNAQTGQWDDVPEWHRVVAWGHLADLMAKYVHKGSKLYVEGRLRTRSYTDSAGVKRKTTEIVASEVILSDSRKGRDQEGNVQTENFSAYPSPDANYFSGDNGTNSTFAQAEQSYGNNLKPVGFNEAFNSQAEPAFSKQQTQDTFDAPYAKANEPSHELASSGSAPVQGSPQVAQDESDDDLPF